MKVGRLKHKIKNYLSNIKLLWSLEIERQYRDTQVKIPAKLIKLCFNVYNEINNSENINNIIVVSDAEY